MKNAGGAVTKNTISQSFFGVTNFSKMIWKAEK